MNEMNEIQNSNEENLLNSKKLFSHKEHKDSDFPSEEDLPLKEVWKEAENKTQDEFYERLFKKILKKFSD